MPKNTKSLALICYDPEAIIGTWTHWIIYNIPTTINSFAENIRIMPEGAELGFTNRNVQRYGGPCPPSGEHHYFFELYALDKKLYLKQPVNRQILQGAMRNHIIAKATLIGRYHRP